MNAAIHPLLLPRLSSAPAAHPVFVVALRTGFWDVPAMIRGCVSWYAFSSHHAASSCSLVALDSCALPGCVDVTGQGMCPAGRFTLGAHCRYEASSVTVPGTLSQLEPAGTCTRRRRCALQLLFAPPRLMPRKYQYMCPTGSPASDPGSAVLPCNSSVGFSGR